jgi:hypothetical protein
MCKSNYDILEYYVDINFSNNYYDIFIKHNELIDKNIIQDILNCDKIIEYLEETLLENIDYAWSKNGDSSFR